MKKFYNQPTCFVVALGTMHMMAESLPVGGSDDTIDDENDILTKENKSVNAWDEEW
ncbi:MAG: hypothetical protein J6W03_01540 [Bacteroidaceae bacterium]|nr:hypothetical protein [Bacteroidaceae bacterium]